MNYFMNVGLCPGVEADLAICRNISVDLLTLFSSLRRPIGSSSDDLQKEVGLMPKYVIERDLPGAGKLSAQELQAISQKSCSVLNGLGPQIQWVQSYVTDEKIYCVYIAPN